MKTNIPNSKTRKYLILVRLLDGEHLSYQHLAQDYFVARSSIANDITYIKSLLAEDDVPLKYDNSGTFIECSEVKKQEVIKRAISRIEKDSKKDDIINLFLDQKLLSKIKKIISDQEISLKFDTPDIYLKNIVLTITILIQRGRNGHHVVFNDSNNLAEYDQLKDYPLCNEIIQSIQNESIYTFSSDELKCLAYLILGSDINFFVQYENIPNNVKEKVNKFIFDVQNALKMGSISDPQLQNDLTIHFYQMMLRLKTHTTIINPLKEEIKNSYSKTYGVVWYYLNNFGNDNHLQISDDEVAFITIHFQAALERNKADKKILFVCPHGIGTSSLALAQLRRILPVNSIVDTVSLLDINNRSLDDANLVVSTIPLPQLSVPVVKVSPLLTKDDMKNVVDKYVDTTMTVAKKNKSQLPSTERLKSLLNGNIIINSQASDKEEVLSELLALNDWKNDEEKEKYLVSINQREQLQSTYLGNGFVIPHGDPKKLSHSCLAVSILNKPIKWGNNKTNVVCLLMITSKDRKLVEPFMEIIMKGIEDKEWFKKEMMEFA
jgi:transcriptional antiterminator